jgi:ketosteroid isomerase-like protein
MKKLFTLLAFATIPFLTNAQEDQQAINLQVWKPFTTAIMNQDVATFVSLHSKDLIRVERDQKNLLDLKAYQSGMEAGWPGWKESIKKSNQKYVFELRFLERISNGTQAFEVGYFKNEVTTATGEKRISYGKFMVALRKEDGKWKILVDSDTRENGTITDEMFAAAQPLN